MINSVVLMGRLTADPELRTTTSGISVTRFTLAVDRNYNKSGEERKADFISMIAWRQNAEFICKYFGKGSMLAVTGSIQTGSYDDKNGNKVYTTDVLIDRASFCGSKTESNKGSSSAATPPSYSSPPNSDFEEIPDEEDLPF
ncbi:MAG: single-stranded DNA-binding protein [Acutalibacteraceae bacterium]